MLKISACRVTALILGLALCAPGQVLVNGAGATFPYPIYAQWFDQFHRLHPEANISYQSIGSGAGIDRLLSDVADFGASDMPVSNSRLAILHVPTVLGAVVPAYNIPGVSGEVNFTRGALARIFLGTLRKWNDAELVKANPGVSLPDAAIIPVHRMDPSGTTFVWTDFLSKTSPAWKAKAGAGATVRWPVGLGARGNEGVAGLVKNTSYSIGYLELVYAVQNRIGYGRVENPAGAFVRADAGSVAAAADGVRVPDDFRISIVNAGGRGAYPVASFTWLLVKAKIADPAKREIVARFLTWMLEDGQNTAESLGYARLPKPVVERARQAVQAFAASR